MDSLEQPKERLTTRGVRGSVPDNASAKTQSFDRTVIEVGAMGAV